MNEKQVLSALGDLTNGALNYYQATQTVMVRDNLIRNYIELLQKQNTDLKDNWNKLKEYISNNNRYFEKEDLEMVSNALNGLDVLDKMQEIEGGMNE